MLTMLKPYQEKFQPVAYVIFRVLFGLFFLGHGVQKAFGWLGGTQQDALGGMQGPFGINLLFVAGVVETIVGIMLIVGLFSSIAAFIGAGQMLFAFYLGHVSREGIWNPFLNGGEKALLFFTAFILIIAMDSGKFSVCSWWENRKK